eukprot:6740218-Prymnesium_polylepis.1
MQAVQSTAHASRATRTAVGDGFTARFIVLERCASGDWQVTSHHASHSNRLLTLTVLTSSHTGTCPVVRRNRGPHLGVGR